MTAASRCRRNGWVAGTRLRSSDIEGYIEVIEITAIGRQAILARYISTNGHPDWTPDMEFNLSDRRWRRA